MSTGKRHFSLWCLNVVLLLGVVAVAQASPLPMLQKTADNMIAKLNANSAEIKQNRQKVYQIVKSTLIPVVDVTAMSQAVLGRHAWQQATPAQRKRFTDLFINMVIGTYAAALSSYSNEKIRFFPVRGDGNLVTVHSEIVRQGAPNVPVSYRCMKRGSAWRVYDFSVEGVSMVATFRSQFAQIIQQQGMDGLLTRMHQHGSQLR